MILGFLEVPIKLSDMVNVDVSSIALTTTRQDNVITATYTPPLSNNVYAISFSGNIATRRYTIEVSFKDDKGGACSNSIVVGEVDRSSTAYTVVTGNIKPLSASPTPAAVAKGSTEDYDDEAEQLYREYVAGLRNNEHKAIPCAHLHRQHK